MLHNHYYLSTINLVKLINSYYYVRMVVHITDILSHTYSQYLYEPVTRLCDRHEAV